MTMTALRTAAVAVLAAVTIATSALPAAASEPAELVNPLPLEYCQLDDLEGARWTCVDAEWSGQAVRVGDAWATLLWHRAWIDAGLAADSGGAFGLTAAHYQISVEREPGGGVSATATVNGAPVLFVALPAGAPRLPVIAADDLPGLVFDLGY